MNQQDKLMVFDPASGDRRPYPSHAEQWRLYHGQRTAWLFDPWTGQRRDARDVGSDVQGLLICPGQPTGSLSDFAGGSMCMANRAQGEGKP